MLAGGCVFSAAELPTSSPDAPLGDAPVVPGADAPGAPDAPPIIDAPPPAFDADVDQCPGGSTLLALGSPREGTIAGLSLYDPTCPEGVPSGGEDLYRVEVPAAPSTDLVIDLDEDAPFDGVLDVTASCIGGSANASCADVGAPGAGEVLVFTELPVGRNFVAVDSLDGGGGYTVRAFLRSVVGAAATCDPTLELTRCSGGLACVEQDAALGCRALAPTSDPGGNGTPCTTPTVFFGDARFTGVTSDADDIDVVAIEVGAPRLLRVTVTDGAGGCPADLVVDVRTGPACNMLTTEASDDNGGLGPCPRLADVALPAGRSYVRVSVAEDAKLPDDDVTWTLILDVY
jgi:hypothetical protein